MEDNFLVSEEDKNKSGVYLIYDENNNVYIGQTTNFEKRYKCSQNKDVRRMMKNGAKFKVIELVEEDEDKRNYNFNKLNREAYWITYYFIKKEYHCVNKVLPTYCKLINKYDLPIVPIDEETWTPICNYKLQYFSTQTFDLSGVQDNLYEVSNFGSVRDKDKNMLNPHYTKRGMSYGLRKEGANELKFYNVSHLMIYNFYYDFLKDINKNVFINDYATHLCDINFTLVNKLTDLEDAERVLYKLNSKLFTYNNELEELNNKINDVQELIKSQELMIEQLKGDENE